MQPLASPSLEQKPFELSAWAILTGLGCVRILKDILHDVFVSGNSLTNLYIDVPLLAVFLLLLLLILKGKLKAVPLWLGFILLLLTTWSFIRLGGVAGSSEYNFMALAVMFTLCYRGRELIIIVSALFLVVIFANVDDMQNGRITAVLFKAKTNSFDSFYTSVAVIGVVLLYFKDMLKVETNQMRHVRELLSRQRTLIRKQHEDLLQQQAILYEATKRLSRDVQTYDDDIRGHDEAITNYIYLSTQNLRLSMSRMKSVPTKFSDTDGLDNNLKEQIDQLNQIVANLITDLNKPKHDHLH